MAVPTLIAISPTSGPASGGDLVRLRGTGFAEQVQVLFGDAVAIVLNVRAAGGESFADIRTPAHPPGAADITLRNLDSDGAPVTGEETSIASAYRFQRAPIVREADLTRVVRALLRELARGGTTVSDIFSTASQNASACEAAMSPERRSINGRASKGVLPSRSFSTPLCVKNSLPSSVMIRSPATLNLKCPGSIMPAWMGPTGIS